MKVVPGAPAPEPRGHEPRVIARGRRPALEDPAMSPLPLAPLALAIGTPVVLVVTLLAGSALGRSVGRAIGGARASRRPWGLGTHQGDAWGALLGALTGLGVGMLGLGMSWA